MELMPEGKRKSLSSQKNDFRCMAWLTSCVVFLISEITNFLQYDLYLVHLIASISLHAQAKKRSWFCFNISSFYFYFGLMQIHVVWGKMNKCSPSSWYCWFLYGSKSSLSQTGNIHIFHGSSGRSYTIILILSIVFCYMSSYSISLSEMKLP